jgi:hypothetical protein
LRPLLDDLVQEQSYLEAYQPSKRSGELGFALRLDAQRVKLWQTNLAEALASLSGTRPLPIQGRQGWDLELSPGPHDLGTNIPPNSKLQTQNPKLFLEFAGVGEWAILGLASTASNGLVADLRARVERNSTPIAGNDPGSAYDVDPVTRRVRPVSPEAPDLWLDAYADLPGVSRSLSLGWKFSENMPSISLAVNSDGTNVRTSAELEFPRPLQIEMEPWNIPTNLIHDPLVGFSAIRGFRPWLKTFKPWNDLGLGTPPNQAFFWVQAGAPLFHFFILPSAEASNQVSKLAQFAVDKLNPLLRSNRVGTFQIPPDRPGLSWHGFPVISPTLGLADSGDDHFIVGGFWRNGMTNRPAPASMSAQVCSITNLVWYDWEQSHPCMGGLLDDEELCRQAFGLQRMARTSGMYWLLFLAPALGNSVTTMTLTAPNRLSFARYSTVGFTGFELSLLADWLESVEFPRGLYTFTAPKPAPGASPSPPLPGQP